MIEEALRSTTFFLARTLPVVAVAIYAVSYSIKRGYLERLSQLIRPRLGRLGLSEIAAVSFAVCFVSPTASYSVLSQAWREKKLDEKEIIAISFLNSFPSVFSHLYTFFVPFVIPVLGFAGVVYTLTRFGVAFIKSMVGLLLSRKWKNGRMDAEVDFKPISPHQNIFRIALIMAVTYFAVVLASQGGVFDKIVSLLSFLPISPRVLAIAGVEFFNVRSAVVLAAGFMDAGLNWRWAVIGLILGNVISFSARAVKHSLPMHVSLFGRFGVKIVLFNSAATLILDVLFILLLLRM
ncbi:nucleoside recognition domain-containing protein [Archaeoglobus neptunius]|uniref:nucleoside recognition domain-containing protein n=1 Tax=Archaeoglobus neptunius TaxID=2798580 RepID=UPI00192773EB|nr:nucleoside recognition domain-containing protein [Archaeoglobus neptunius]